MIIRDIIVDDIIESTKVNEYLNGNYYTIKIKSVDSRLPFTRGIVSNNLYYLIYDYLMEYVFSQYRNDSQFTDKLTNVVLEYTNSIADDNKHPDYLFVRHDDNGNGVIAYPTRYGLTPAMEIIRDNGNYTTTVHELLSTILLDLIYDDVKTDMVSYLKLYHLLESTQDETIR